MADLSIYFVLVPPTVFTLFLLFFIRSKIYRKIAFTLIAVLWANALFSTLELTTYEKSVWNGSQGVDDSVILAQLGLYVFHAGAQILEQLLLWGFVAFVAVIIGSFYLFLTCLRKKDGSLPERMSQMSFKGSLQNPLVSQLDVNGIQSYLIIGLVTMPSMISIMIALASASAFAFNTVIYVLLFYRFSLLAYTRIAKKADLHFGKEDLGSKYEKRMLSWFTILNLILSVVLLSYTLLASAIAINLAPILFVVEIRELISAVLILPFAEGFAAFFFSRFWHFWARLGTRLRGISLKSTLYSLTRGTLIGGACFILFYSILSFVTAMATFFSVFNTLQPPIFNNQLGATEIYNFLGDPSNSSAPLYSTPYVQLLLPVLWSFVCIFLFQFIKVLIGGALTHRKSVAPEYTIFVASIVMVVMIWLVMPATNFFLTYVPVSLVASSGNYATLYLYIPAPVIAQFVNVAYGIVWAPTDLLYILFLDVPIWVFGSLFFMYFFKLRRDLIPVKKERGVFLASEFFKLFVSFCVVTLSSVAVLVAMDPASPLGDFVHGLISRLWFPNYREQAIFTAVGSSWVFFHNMIRFMLTVFAPLLLWVSAVGFWKYLKDRKQKSDVWYILGIVVLGIEAIVLVDRFTYIAIIGIPLILAALYRVFYRVVKRTPPKTMFRTTFLKISFYSLILCEIYSTAIAIADRYMFPIPPNSSFYSGGNLGLLSYLLILIPHGLVEIPAAVLAALIGLYIARRMSAAIDEDEKKLDKFIAEGNKIVFSKQIWYPIIFVTVFFVVAAVIEIYVTWSAIEPLVNAFGFA